MSSWFDLVEIIVGVAIGLAVGWIIGKKSGRRSAINASDMAVAASAPEALYEIDEMEISVDFDENGSGMFSRSEAGIVPRFAMAELIIPYRFSVTPQGKLEPPEVRGLDSSSVRWESKLIEPTRIIGSIILRGPFSESQKLAGYTLRQRFEKGFFVDREQTRQAYKDSAMPREYVGVAATVPARTLRCRIAFPPSHHVLSEGPSPCAFIGETEFPNEVETARIASSFSVTEGTAILTVSNPRPGVRYAITWLAPAASTRVAASRL